MRLIICFFYLTLIAINTLPASSTVIDSLPLVFLIGEKEAAYEDLVEECSEPLFSISDNSMDKAYGSWLGMLHDIEVFAVEDSFDIKGVKIWINTFWNGDGSIKHIAYYPKPNSKNIDYDKMTIFLKKFSAQYRFKESFEKCFSHYGSATFPTHAQYYLEKN